MSRKLGHAKSAQPESEQLMNQVWHSLVDTLRLLPSVPTKTAETSTNETHTIDEALDKVSLLISLRKGETVQPERIQSYIPPSLSIIAPSTPTSSSGGGGVKRKRRLSVSVSPAPPPLPTAASFDSNLSSIASPAPPPPAATGVKDRSATPMSREQVGKVKKELYSDQLPLDKGRRVAFKMPNENNRGDGEDEDEEWILATIKRCILGDKMRYEVQDYDDETKNYKTTLRSIILLPDPKSPTQLEVYPKNSIVLGLYPDTTSLYQATVIAAPNANQKGASGKGDIRANKGNYLLAFVDDGDNVHEVDPLDVTKFPSM